MSMTVRRNREIHAENGGWFRARWHFSFGGYHDHEHMGVGPLRVFNDDRLTPGAVWPMHPHRDIDSCTYVSEGLFEHSDSLGNGGVLKPGGVQVMRFSHAGALHSELNASRTEPMRFLQFWFLPSVEGLKSSVQQHQYSEADRTDTLLQIMSPPGENGLDLAQDARVWVGGLTAGARVGHEFASDRGGYLYVLSGTTDVQNVKLSAGDAVKIRGSEALEISADDEGEIILIDVPLEFHPVGAWAGTP